MGLKYRDILVAVDGSKEAEWAFKKGIAIAKRNGAVLSLLHVIDTRSYAAIDSYDHTIGERAIKYAEELLGEYKTNAERCGLTKIHTYVEYGSPKVVIPKKASEKGKDLIICGATGLNAVERFLIGSVSEHITRAAKCDVLVVRTEEPDEEE
ncbi:universal stress protein [Rossellomorea marisflavi]|uniref:universal stress protein n=1 Tax=Rossellomorea marisflavi TaxID=189381 RepID=UPI001EE2FB58|nr:universal stress protein [Rossellomorea marisflavi]UKS64308.1 universal stress protein [Rossellomorea marisflavi]